MKNSVGSRLGQCEDTILETEDEMDVKGYKLNDTVKMMRHHAAGTT